MRIHLQGVVSLTALLCLLAPRSLRAEETPVVTKVAVMQFTAPAFEAGVVENLYGLFVAEIDAIPGYQVISRDEIEAMLGFEQQKAMLGCDDTSCLAEIAGALGVDKVVSGKVGKVGKIFVLNITMIDHKSARVEKRVSKTVTGADDVLILAIQESARELVGVSQRSGAVAVTGSSGTEDSAKAGAHEGDGGVLPLVLLASGGAGLVVGGALLGVSALRYGAYQDATDPQQAEALAGEVPIWWVGSGVAAGVGLVAAAVGGVLVAVSE